MRILSETDELEVNLPKNVKYYNLHKNHVSYDTTYDWDVMDASSPLFSPTYWEANHKVVPDMQAVFVSEETKIDTSYIYTSGHSDDMLSKIGDLRDKVMSDIYTLDYNINASGGDVNQEKLDDIIQKYEDGKNIVIEAPDYGGNVLHTERGINEISSRFFN